MSCLSVVLPLHTVSEANGREHWAKKSRRVREHRSTACHTIRLARKPPVPVVVTLTRIAPRALDDDNLRGALKATRDGVADAFGLDDRDPRIKWRYCQERGQVRAYAVRVVVQSAASALQEHAPEGIGG